ncbi:hypothetical protein EON64_06825 [archaeon]|nr:MAG: hypothetical protein EON64_06825 [archaeon]
MLLSCAEMVTLNPHAFCVPTLLPKGTLMIEKGRHPILGLGHLPLQFVANSTCVAETQPVQIVFGPNGSGKVSLSNVFLCLCATN